MSVVGHRSRACAVFCASIAAHGFVLQILFRLKQGGWANTMRQKCGRVHGGSGAEQLRVGFRDRAVAVVAADRGGFRDSVGCIGALQPSSVSFDSCPD